MKVLFTHSYFLHFDKKQLKAAMPYAPLATLYAAAFLRESGHDVRLADLQFSHSADDIRTHIDGFKPHVLVIYDDSFNYLTKMCLTNMREAAFRMQEIAASSNIPVIVSSSDATDHADAYLSHGTSYIIIGEAEQTLKELLEAITVKTSDTENIQGLAFIKDGKTFRTAPRKVMRELDQLPVPAWDLIDTEKYRKRWQSAHGYFSVNLVTTRGCPYKCNWCAKPVYGNRYTSHSPQRVADMISDMKNLFEFDHIWFADDIFGLKPGWVQDFASIIARKGYKLNYKIQSRADILTSEVVEALARSGCTEVWIGAESGSQKILDAMDKGTTTAQIESATLLLKKNGIKPCFFLQFGYPGEEKEDIAKTIAMVDTLRPYDIGVSVSYPLPGTLFYENVKQQMQSKQNWADSDDLEIMFQGTFSVETYRDLQRYVHYHFRTNQAVASLSSLRLNTRSMLAPYYFMRKHLFRRKLKHLS
jgi:anaerobic magnesium-protoporphyrin IX monomethyl ester cyclase